MSGSLTINPAHLSDDDWATIRSFLDAAKAKGEVVVVIGPPDLAAGGLDDAAVDALLREALRSDKPRVAAAAVAAATGRTANELYRRALALPQERG